MSEVILKTKPLCCPPCSGRVSSALGDRGTGSGHPAAGPTHCVSKVTPGPPATLPPAPAGSTLGTSCPGAVAAPRSPGVLGPVLGLEWVLETTGLAGRPRSQAVGGHCRKLSACPHFPACGASPQRPWMLSGLPGRGAGGDAALGELRVHRGRVPA